MIQIHASAIPVQCPRPSDRISGTQRLSSPNKQVLISLYLNKIGLDVATCGVANATGFEPLATNFSLLVASLATAISSYYLILFSFSFPQIYDGMNE